jgi:hypothetical protein
MLEKAPHGQPCNGCGQCCMEQLCPLGVALFGEPWDRRCPALEPELGTDRWVCGLMAHPMAYAMRMTLLHGVETMRQTASHLIGAGRGCDAQLDDEPADEAFRASMWAMRNPALTDRCLKVWGLTRMRRRPT